MIDFFYIIFFLFLIEIIIIIWFLMLFLLFFNLIVFVCIVICCCTWNICFFLFLNRPSLWIRSNIRIIVRRIGQSELCHLFARVWMDHHGDITRDGDERVVQLGWVLNMTTGALCEGRSRYLFNGHFRARHAPSKVEVVLPQMDVNWIGAEVRLADCRYCGLISVGIRRPHRGLHYPWMTLLSSLNEHSFTHKCRWVLQWIWYVCLGEFQN